MLKEQNKKLEEHVIQLQRQIDTQGGQLDVLVNFVHESLRDQLDRRVELATSRAIEQLAVRKGTPPSATRAKKSPKSKSLKSKTSDV